MCTCALKEKYNDDDFGVDNFLAGTAWGTTVTMTPAAGAEA